MTERKVSALFRHIEKIHGSRKWGSMLDAGTGVNSINWVAGLSTEKWTAVTGSEVEAEQTRMSIRNTIRPQDQIIQGNWADPDFMSNEAFDTVLAGYLLGAIEGFAPYFQASLFPRLRLLSRGALYVTGLEPYVPTSKPISDSGRIIWEIGRFRDACVLLAGGMPYREYPSRWVIEQLNRSNFKIQDATHFNVAYKEQFINAQINISVNSLELVSDRSLVDALVQRAKALRDEALKEIQAHGALRHCQNYVIAAEPV